MELFIWMWAYDKRLFCGYTVQAFVYIWLIPVLLSTAVLGLTCLLRLTSDQTELHMCMASDDSVKHGAIHLQKLMLI